MRKLILATVALLLCATWAQGQAVSSLGATFNTTSGTKTVTATPAVGDLIIIVTAHTGNTSTATPTDDQSGTYTTCVTAKKATNADTMMVHVRNSLVSSAVSTVFSHAPGTTTGGGLEVFKVTGMTFVKCNAIRQAAKQENQAAATPAPAFAASVLTGDPTLAAVFNATNSAHGGLTAPTGWTQSTGGNYNTPATGLDTEMRNSGFTGTTITWGSSSSTAFASVAIELDPSSATGTPLAFHIRTCSNSQSATALTAYDCRSPEPSLAGNRLIAFVEYGTSSTVTVTDDQSQTWTCLGEISGGQKLRLCYMPNTAAGVVKVHFAFGTSPQFVSAIVLEVKNTPTWDALDASCGQHNVATASAACGSMTTTADGDYVVEYCAQDSASNNQITWTAQSGFALKAADRYDSQAVQDQVQSTAGSVNPTLTMSNAGVNSTCVGAAFKPASAGQGDTGMYTRAMLNNSLNPANGYATGSTTIQAPCAGNAIFLAFLGEPNVTVTGTPTDSNSNTYTSTGATVTFGTSGNLQAWYAQGATCSASMTITFTTTGSQVSGSMITVFDIVGSGGYDKRGTATGNQTTAGTLTTASVTPTNANGITFWVTGVASDTVPGVNTGTFVSAIPTPVSSPNDVMQNNGYGAYSYTSGAAQTFVANSSLGGAAYGNWASTADVFYAPLAGGAPSNLPLMGCCAANLLAALTPQEALQDFERRN